MYKVLLLAIMVVSLCNCEKEVLYVDFADDQFLKTLLTADIDKNHDGKISYSEAEEGHTLFIVYTSIKDFSGIRAFKNLDTLICYSNLLPSLDVSQMRNLVYLNCWGNTLTSLDISRNTGLKYLDCSRNNLSALDVTKNPSLEKLYERILGNKI